MKLLSETTVQKKTQVVRFVDLEEYDSFKHYYERNGYTTESVINTGIGILVRFSITSVDSVVHYRHTEG